MVITRSGAMYGGVRAASHFPNVAGGIASALGAYLLNRFAGYAQGQRYGKQQQLTIDPPVKGSGGSKRSVPQNRNMNGRVRNLSKMSRGRRKFRKSRRTSRKTKRKSKFDKTASLAGGKAITGKPDEEDASVKKHMKRGCVIEYGTSGVVATTGTGNHGGYIVHSTMPQTTVMTAFLLAILKAMLVSIGQSFKKPDDVVQNIGSPSITQTNLTWNIDYYVGTSAQNLAAGAVVGTDTYYTWALAMEAALEAITALNSNQVVKFSLSRLRDSTALTVGNNLARLDLDVSKVKFDMVSNLVYQNRSGSTALDVSQDPLFEVQSTGKGTGPIGGDGFGTALTANFFVDDTTGVLQADAGNNRYLLAEPSKAYFTNTQGIVNTVMNPGVMKQSKLKSHYEFTLTKIFPYLKFGVNNNKLVLGKFKHIWYRKTIDLAAVSAYNVAYQHHFAIGATCIPKQDFRTTPYVANIQ